MEAVELNIYGQRVLVSAIDADYVIGLVEAGRIKICDIGVRVSGDCEGLLQRALVTHAIGRPLDKSQQVRRINKDKFDLRRQNIKIVKTVSKVKFEYQPLSEAAATAAH